MRNSPRVLRLLGLCVLLFTVPLFGQSLPSGRISQIEIESLAPFEISFRYENQSISSLQRVGGTVALMDRLGQTIEVLRIDSFLISAGETSMAYVGSRWDFQQTGIYLLDVALDLGAGELVSASLVFRILPVRLPLAPAVDGEGEGMYTVYQQPVDWGLLRVRAPEAWEITHGNENVVVAVIDSGVDHTFPQLEASMWVNWDEVPGNGLDDDRNGYVDDIHGWDFRDNDASSLTGSSLHSHGTMVASIIAAQPGEVPIVGVAPGVRIMDVRFLDSSKTFQAQDWPAFVDAVEYAVDNGADIINLSIFANGRPPRDFERALEDATARGVIVVGITGNNGDPNVMYPGRFDSVLAVSATTRDDRLAAFSNYGSGVGLCAPGESVTGLTKGGKASTRSGTSFAAPYVTGVLALMLSVAPELTPSEAIGIVERSARDLGSRGTDESYGVGLVDAVAALLEARR